MIIAPLAIIGALLFVKRSTTPRRHVRIDVVGAMLVASGMFLLVFALSEGGAYGWWMPMRDVSVGGRDVWSASAPVAGTPILLAIAFVILSTFVVYERRKERRHDDPLFEFAHLRHRDLPLRPDHRRGGRDGPVRPELRAARVPAERAPPDAAAERPVAASDRAVHHRSARRSAAGSSRVVGTTVVVRLGLLSYVLGLVFILHSISLDITQWQLLPGLAFYGIGIGFAGAQLTNVVLSEIPNESTGVASGANTTMRQVGAALGVAMIGSLLAAQIVSNSVRRINAATVSAAAKAQALAGVHAQGAFYRPPASTSAHDTSVLQHALQLSVASGTRIVLVFAIVVVSCGALLSLLIPSKDVATEPALRPVSRFEPVELPDIDPALIEGHAV